MTDPEIGQLVQINPACMQGGDPKYRKKIASIEAVEGPYAGQGERKFVTLRFHHNGEIMSGISSDLIELA